ncbi:hypothetical protein J8I26_06530 [Herbaspirillum sp. LeCh32-8]|uniref:hypothetical protein n=1 Tax=Herbaspirillum sp. LeCh32-8 TaxID=2821356 RepID=UPI001AEAE2B8|nr:hypothetical protein [Herbaspirillum sp. LeCh32-8]MBP0597749.1 hypothetical protein [Herbaspirillum sp. LeCh32-8]
MRHSTRRKKKLVAQGSGKNSVTLYYQKIPAEQFIALPIEQRYCLLLMGHIHHELNWIQRMAFVATREAKFRHEAQRQAQMMQSLMLARLFFGKLFEFSKLLSPQNSLLRQFITKNYRPGDEQSGSTRVAELLEQFNTEKWIRMGRNKHFMHYPELNDVRATLEDLAIRWDLEIYHGSRSTNTLYPTSDVFANYAWFRLVNSEAPMTGLGEALDTLTTISRLELSTLEESIGYFVDGNLMPLNQNERVNLKVTNSKENTLTYFHTHKKV